MSAQLEDGYTRTANELMERLMKIKLNGTQHNIVYCIVRNTYGFQRKSHAMSLSFISTAIETHKDLVKRELDKLIDFKIVKVFKEGDYTHSREIGMNKNVSEWKVDSKPISRQSTKQSTVNESVYLQSPNQSSPSIDQLVYQERKVFKENIKENTTGDFDKVRIAFNDIHKVLDMPMQDSPMLSKMLGDGILPELIIDVMKEKNKSGVRTIKYYVEAIKERHEGKESQPFNQRFISPIEQEAINAKRRAEEIKNHVPLTYNAEFEEVEHATSGPK